MKHKAVIRAREKLLRELPPPAEILRGSLLRRIIRHRQGGPKCARGQGHPVWVLTITYPGGRNKQISIPVDRRDQAQRWWDNYQRLKQKLEAICELNHELLRPED
jgi:uncharacterized protein DUF6788